MVQIPQLKLLMKQGQISPSNVDVFLEKGVFNRDETRKILKAGQDAGLLMNFHGDFERKKGKWLGFHIR